MTVFCLPSAQIKMRDKYARMLCECNRQTCIKSEAKSTDPLYVDSWIYIYKVYTPDTLTVGDIV